VLRRQDEIMGDEIPCAMTVFHLPAGRFEDGRDFDQSIWIRPTHFNLVGFRLILLVSAQSLR